MAWHEGNNGGMTAAIVNSRYGVHNFGLTYSLTSDQLSVRGGAPVNLTQASGYPNPTYNPDINFGFQIRPLPKSQTACPTGFDCCNVMTVQTGHTALNVAMADGSVRSVFSDVSLDTWAAVMLPKDGQVVGTDW
jgi:prepilin-type processing-associated H-X9-DG protein